MLIDVFAHKKWLMERSDDDRKAALIETAKHYALQTLQSGNFEADITDAEVLERIMQVNYMGAVYCTQYGHQLNCRLQIHFTNNSLFADSASCESAIGCEHQRV